MKKHFIIMFLSFNFLAFSQATNLIDNFDYPTGNPLTDHGWFAHSGGTTNPVSVSSSGLSWTTTNYIGSNVGLAASITNTGQDVNKPLSMSVNSGAVYASFLMKVNAEFSAAGEGFFFHLGYYNNQENPVFTSLNTGFRARTHVRLGTDPSTQFKLGLSFNANLPQGTTTDLNIGQTYLVVVKYEFIDGTSNDQVSLFVFADGDSIASEPGTPTLGPFTPTPTDPLDPESALAPDAPIIQAVALRQYNASQDVTVDGIFVRQAWNLTDPGCSTFITTDSAICNSITPGANDTYTATLNFIGGASGAAFVVSASAGSVGGDDPNVTASGTIVVSNIPEGSNVTITLNNTSNGGFCNLQRFIAKPDCNPTPAVDYLIEHFDYEAGSELANNNWNIHSAGGANPNPILISNGGLSFETTNYIGSGIGNAALVTNNGQDLNKQFTENLSSGAVYTSFLMKVNEPFASTGAGFFFHYGYFNNTTTPDFTSMNTAFRGRTHVALGTDTNTQYKLGLSFNSNDPTATSSDLNIGETYMVVVKYQFVDGANNDQVSLYVFADGDDISSEPTTPTLGPFTGTAADAPVLQAIALRQYNANQRVTVDGMYVRTVWDFEGQDIDDLPTISEETCGNNYDVVPGETIAANPFAGASNYRFKFVDESNEEYFVERANGSMTIHQFAAFIGSGFQYDHVYQVSAEAYVDGEWTGYGPSCEFIITGDPRTKLRADFCDLPLAAMDTRIFVDRLPLFNQYVYTVLNTSTDQSVTFTRTDPQATGFRLTQEAASILSAGTTYEVTVKAKLGDWETTAGLMCTVTTPTIPGTVKLRAGSCDVTLTSMINQAVLSEVVPNAIEYEFEVTNTTLNTAPVTFLKSNWVLPMSDLGAGFTTNTTYSIRVRARIGAIFNIYGDPCTVTTPSSVPVPQLTALYCDQNFTTHRSLYATRIFGSQEFTFEVVNSNNDVLEVVRTSNFFHILYHTNPTFYGTGGSFVIRVKVKVNNEYGDYGTPCMVTISPPALLNYNLDNGFASSDKIEAYPNPFKNQFTVKLTDLTSANIQVFDINGRLVENLTTNDTFDVEMGHNLNAGVYLVRVEQNGDTQSFKMIKK